MPIKNGKQVVASEIEWKKEITLADRDRETNAETAERLGTTAQQISNARTFLGMNKIQGRTIDPELESKLKKVVAMRKKGAKMVECWRKHGGPNRTSFMYRYNAYIRHLWEEENGISQ